MEGTRMKTDESLALFERLLKVMPGASTRTVTHYDPFPVCIDHCEGCRIRDVDGNEYIDLLNNYTPLVHGHAHPAIVEAITKTAQRGLASALPSPIALQGELAERLCSRTPSIDLVRFTNSASEAVMMAVRVARAYTGRDEVVFPGNGYHGSWDQVNVSGVDEEHPDGNPEGMQGIPGGVAALAHLVRFNDVAHLEEIMGEYGSRVACILLEPILGHILDPGEPEFIAAAARIAHEHGALLILDETITYRLWVGGWQTQNGIEADLTTLGKTIGGGMPVGAFGGKEEFMRILDPRRPDALPAHGTMNGHALGMAAGCASLDLLDQPAIARINDMGERLAVRLDEAGHDAGIGMRVHACGSLLQFNCSDPLAFHRACLEEGLYVAPRGSMNLSTPMDEAVLDEVVGRWQRAVARVASKTPQAV
jgi:glutamate-1-semialdehyde 2,1-aminomutase